jgi:hypothetical protein
MPKWNPESALPWLERSLPPPVRRTETHNGHVLLAGAPPAVVVRLNGAAMRVGVFAALQWGDLTALADESIASVIWNKLPDDEQTCIEVVSHLAAAAAALHKARRAAASD